MSTVDAPAVPVARIAPPADAPADAGEAPSAAPPAAEPPTPAAAGERIRFLDALPAEMTEGAQIPLVYRLVSAVAYGDALVPQRVAESTHHNTSSLTCTPFYKPLSRCVGGRR